MTDASSLAVDLKLIERRIVTHDLIFLRFQPQGDLTFRPGQYTSLTIGGQTSYFSFSSAPGDDTVDFYVRVYESKRQTPGAFLGSLWNMNIGQTAQVPPQGMGTFGLDEAFARHAMIATTTGITPLRSILRAWRAGYFGDRVRGPMAMLYGGSYADELMFDAEFRAMAGDGALLYSPTVSRDDEPARNAGWTGRRGRVNSHALEELARLGFPPEGTAVYLCGNAGMIADLGGRGIEGGEPEGRLLSAGYTVKTQF